MYVYPLIIQIKLNDNFIRAYELRIMFLFKFNSKITVLMLVYVVEKKANSFIFTVMLHHLFNSSIK